MRKIIFKDKTNINNQHNLMNWKIKITLITILNNNNNQQFSNNKIKFHKNSQFNYRILQKYQKTKKTIKTKA